jgi:hypothetical protein
MPPDPSAKVQGTPALMAIFNETNVNQDQLTKRQKLIAEIEQSLSAKYDAANSLISYVMRFGHARTSMHAADIPNIEAVLQSLSGVEQEIQGYCSKRGQKRSYDLGSRNGSNHHGLHVGAWTD